LGREAVVIVTGDIAREISKASRETGAFAPEDEMRRRINEYVAEARSSGAVVIMEGFPRTLPQLVLAEQILDSPLHVIMETPVMTCIRRLIGRGRQDDTPDNIGNRISDHQKIVGEVMTAIRGGDLWEDYLAVPNNDLIHCKQIAISAEW
jgi:adenylate kinase family enzyme